MASWWTTADMLDSLDLEENSIMSRVIQAVGLFGDILSLEDTMAPILSESKREDGFVKSPDNTEGTPSGEEEEEEMEKSVQKADDEAEVMMEETEKEAEGQQVQEWKDCESKGGKREDGEKVEKDDGNVETEEERTNMEEDKAVKIEEKETESVKEELEEDEGHHRDNEEEAKIEKQKEEEVHEVEMMEDEKETEEREEKQEVETEKKENEGEEEKEEEKIDDEAKTQREEEKSEEEEKAVETEADDEEKVMMEEVEREAEDQQVQERKDENESKGGKREEEDSRGGENVVKDDEGEEEEEERTKNMKKDEAEKTEEKKTETGEEEEDERGDFPQRSDPDEEIRFLVNLFCAAAEREQQTGEKILELLSSVCSYDDDQDFLLDLYSQVKDFETKTGRRVLPALLSVLQSPTFWSINLSERKVSILLEVLKLQSEKKEVKLTGCSDEESEVRSLLQCLPYISRLSFPRRSDPDKEIRFLVNLFCAAAEREQQTGEKILELLSSLCSDETFPFKDRYMDYDDDDDDDDKEYQCHFLLDLYSQVKDCETKTGRRVLPALQSVFQSPTVWSINLSERKASILLEVLKLQSEKKEVELTGCSDEESEVRSFLQCLPYISKLSFPRRSDPDKEIRFLVNLFCAAAEREQQTGEKILELLSSLCSDETFPFKDRYMDYDDDDDDDDKEYQCHFLLDLYSQVKDCETKTGRRVLPALQSVFQSPTVWSINLSERKASILLEVLKLQSEKKEVELTGCSDEESEVRSFLQCLPYISKLR
ncbi:uncharacterized protein [Thunnus thynnus]|uniref:uncharacterized protein n=1 Tax=Thunnus thynnus TaxID=8237 RepID=UPI003527D950